MSAKSITSGTDIHKIGSLNEFPINSFLVDRVKNHVSLSLYVRMNLGITGEYLLLTPSGALELAKGLLQQLRPDYVATDEELLSILSAAQNAGQADREAIDGALRRAPRHLQRRRVQRLDQEFGLGKDAHFGDFSCPKTSYTS